MSIRFKISIRTVYLFLMDNHAGTPQMFITESFVRIHFAYRVPLVVLSAVSSAAVVSDSE
jgi:hypothetical protein